MKLARAPTCCASSAREPGAAIASPVCLSCVSRFVSSPVARIGAFEYLDVAWSSVRELRVSIANHVSGASTDSRIQREG